MFFGKDTYSGPFKIHVCSVCRLCDAENPSFCMMMYGGDPDRFFEILRFINVIRALKPELIPSFYTFEAFCGLFCNSYKECPARGPNCSNLPSVIGCYECFVGQCGVGVSMKVKAQIWQKFSGINTQEIGKVYRLPTKNPLKTIAKRRRKKINKVLKKAQKAMKNSFNLNTSDKKVKVKRKKPVESTFFCNDDEEWERTIDSYLNSETNNRQPAEAA